jgi:Ribosomal protein L7/L12 C-terminal domain
MKASSLSFLMDSTPAQQRAILLQYIEASPNLLDRYIEKALGHRMADLGCAFYDYNCDGFKSSLNLSDNIYNKALCQTRIGNKVSAIKIIRDATAIGLKEAKCFVEQTFYVKDYDGYYREPNQFLRPRGL